MKKRNVLKVVSILLLISLLIVGCGKSSDTGGAGNNNPMNYVKAEALKESIESGSNDYVILDVRKIADYNEAHIKGAFSADQDKAKDGDSADGTANLKAALKEATGNEAGSADNKYVLACYKGKSYAQTATDLLIEMGVKADQIYTLEGGLEAWRSGGDDYTKLLQSK